MASVVVHGKDIDLYVQRSGVFVFTACATNVSIERRAAEINITTANSGRANEYLGGDTDADISFEGVITLDELGAWQYEDFVAAIGTVIMIRLDFTNDYGDRLRYEMSALITAVGAQGDVNDFGAFSVTVKRSGEETMTKSYSGAILDSDDLPILDSNGRPLRS